MVNMHREKSSGPKYQMGKLGIHDNPAIARKTKSVMMPHRTNLFPGWDLKISQNAQIVPRVLPLWGTFAGKSCAEVEPGASSMESVRTSEASKIPRLICVSM